MILEHVDRRVLGAIRLVDAVSGAEIKESLDVRAEGVRFARNQRGYYVLFDAPGLQEHTHAFLTPPAAPPLGSIAVQLTVSDPAGRYMPRLAAITLPRDPDTQNVEADNSLFRPMTVPLLPSPSMAVSSGWAAVRVTVLAEGARQPLPRALLRVTRTVDGEPTLLGRGLSDSHGDALVAIAGIPVTTWAEEESESVIVTEIEATLQAVFDPAAGPIVDPDDLEARMEDLASASAAINLASGQEVRMTLLVPVP